MREKKKQEKNRQKMGMRKKNETEFVCLVVSECVNIITNDF